MSGHVGLTQRNSLWQQTGCASLQLWYSSCRPKTQALQQYSLTAAIFGLITLAFLLGFRDAWSPRPEELLIRNEWHSTGWQMREHAVTYSRRVSEVYIAGDNATTSAEAAQDVLLEGVERDLAPFRHRGITLQMIEQAYCVGTADVSSFRVQIIDNQVYIAGETEGFHDLNLRNKKILASVIGAFPDSLPDVDFVFQGSDWMPPNSNGTHENCQQQGPIFTANKQAHDAHGILFPDESWLDWDQTQALISTASKRLEWHKREPRLLFRGAPTGDRAYWLDTPGVLESEELDVKVVSEWWGAGRSEYLSPAEQCRSKYLLYFAGNTWASRLKKLLLCNSTVVVHPSPYVGFWWHLLEHGHNVHVVEPIQRPEDSGEELAAAVRELKSNDTRAREIAANGFHLALHVLTPEAILMYWHRLLTEYAKLQRFTPTLHVDAIPLDRSIFDPQEHVQRPQWERTCHICTRMA
ncbi:hypothetical protein WJX84_003297 [Apatococcus fuscideae]|uniref:Glycosyl transferase CAP10 domain-containing protein n=1 Tax=Apatococcus fuscideae TaxID=2026836 RepID=A0AAW1T422_9CHLO